MVTIPAEIEKYLSNEEAIPLIEHNGSLWYHITEKERALFAQFVADIDRIPETVWRKYTDSVLIEYSFKGNLAARVVRNCIIREE